MRKLGITAPQEADRLIGFTIPSGGEFYICDHDEVWLVRIDPPRVERTGYGPYDFVEERPDFLGLVFEGLHENEPILSAGEAAISYQFRVGDACAIVDCTAGGRSTRLRFETFSRSWFAVSLSHDGRHLVMADPYKLEVYEVA